MKPESRLQALSNFLMTQRAKLHPHTVGLPPGQRRRTPGLRREEVAALAGVSTTWYTWLEQGRDIKVSPSVLDAIAGALQLNTDERKYLYDLALESAAHSKLAHPQNLPVVSPSLERILQELRFCPTIISDRKCQIVGWNAAAAQVFLNFEQVPIHERNMIQLLFAKKELRSLAVNWEHFARGFLSIFRAYYGQYVADPWYAEFIESMTQHYPDFSSLWHESEVSSAPTVLIEFRHAKAGKMLFDLTSLQVQGSTELRCSIYTPVQDTQTESKLSKLLEGM
ncbi:transcriptional regulator with XRE-family HTH domain [Paenibacillus shirakamiensis]|uniref:Transcriptional regulator with XRE-family HTH domain n=1 Tax=Paenibacillus shirakamiensis TaxID=1265935 RepID=A0ABS4JK97_9BACL|nr:helix-turn-helix transcriptional regulator [Paenibacillus shirakamiensis]MBP2001526.1 transcriptional regulator with XRE-family HTH domain [Paenibacillus shirakamiensis]